MGSELSKLKKFVFTSGFGWLLDFTLYILLIKLTSFSYYVANLTGAICAVTFVFFISIYKIFLSDRTFIFLGFIIYFMFQAISINLYSYLIDITSLWILKSFNNMYYIPIIVKIFYTPFSLITNYFFMKFLTNNLLKVK